MEARIGGARIHYVDAGERSLVPIVLVHGFPFSHAMWAPQLDVLKGKARVVAYDVRGHGRTEPGDGQLTLELFADDLLGLLDFLKIEKAVLCGLSMGGYIVLRAVEKAPQRARGLILADTKSEADSNEAKLKRAATVSAVKKDGVPAFAEGFMKAIFAPETLEKRRDLLELAKGLISANPPLGICGALLAMAGRTDTTPGLAKIAVPTLVLVGEQDTLTPPAAAKSLQENIPGAKLKVIPGAGHMSNLENPEAFNAALLGFLASLQ